MEAKLRTFPAAAAAGAADRQSDPVVAFFTATDADYGAWSRGFNMHFGYYARGMNPLDRESMVARMNEQVVARLALPGGGRVADLGCGCGAVARALVRHHPAARVSGVTVVPAQIERGEALNRREGCDDLIAFVLRDFADTGLPAAAYDGAYAVESACYAAGPDKRPLLAEAYRLLKPGGRLVIADCFRRSARPLSPLLRAIYGRWCAGWAVPEMAQVDAMRAAMARIGFDQIEFRDVSWNVAPSVAHVPWVAGSYLLRELAKGRGRLAPWRWHHFVASVLSIALGVSRDFGYYIASCRKPR